MQAGAEVLVHIQLDAQDQPPAGQKLDTADCYLIVMCLAGCVVLCHPQMLQPVRVWYARLCVANLLVAPRRLDA